MAKKSNMVKLSPPWDGHMSMLASFFAGDNRVRVGYVGKDGVGRIEVFEPEMLDALSQVIRGKVRFGNVTLKVDVVLADGIKPEPCKKMTDLEALKYVLKKNPAFSKIKKSSDGMFEFVFCIFKPVVLMWYNDNLGSPWKLSASTFEEQADFVFKTELGVQFTTEPPKGVKFRKAAKKVSKK